MTKDLCKIKPKTFKCVPSLYLQKKNFLIPFQIKIRKTSGTTVSATVTLINPISSIKTSPTLRQQKIIITFCLWFILDENVLANLGVSDEDT